MSTQGSLLSFFGRKRERGSMCNVVKAVYPKTCLSKRRVRERFDEEFVIQ